MKKLFYSFLLVSVALALQISCSDDPEPTPKSAATDILTFTINDFQTGAATIDATSHTVAVEVANGTNLGGLLAEFTISPGATSDPATSAISDYTNPVTITVTAEDGATTQAWTVTVTEAAPGPSTATDILTFSITGQTSLTGDATAHTIDVEVANGTVLTALTADFTLSAGATSDPVSGVEDDYTSAVIITVTAEDNTTTEDWTVTVTAGTAELSSENDVLTFIITEQTGDAAVIDATTHRVEVVVVAGTDLANLIPTYTVSTGAMGNGVVDGVVNDFSNGDRTLLVTAEDGTEQIWKVGVTIEGVLNTATDILTWGFDGTDWNSPADINDVDHTVTAEVANGTDLTALTAIFVLSGGEITGATSSPGSNTVQDYSTPLTITVTAEDGTTTQAWTVTVTVAEPAGETTVLFGDGGTDKATGITDLVVDGVTYDVEMVNDHPANVYGAFPGTYTFTTSATAIIAIDAVLLALNNAAATLVGPVGKEDTIVRIGYQGEEVTAGKNCNFETGEFVNSGWNPAGFGFRGYNNYAVKNVYAKFTPK